MSASPVPHRVLRFSITTLALVLLCLGAAAESNFMPRGIGVVLGSESNPNEVSFERSRVISPGTLFVVHVIGEYGALIDLQGFNGAQFKVDVDPRLNIIGKTAGADAGLALEGPPDEWSVSILDCQNQTPHLLQYILELPAGATDIENLRISITDMSDRIMALAWCFGSLATPAVASGSVLLNPSPASIVHFVPNTTALVEGRELRLGWETASASSVDLDGSPVAAFGQTVLMPTADTVYTLTATEGLTSNSSVVEVDVIRAPRINHFTAVAVGDQVQLSWDVDGVDRVSIDSQSATLLPRAETMVSPSAQGWTLSATNEWGTSSAYATLDDVSNQPPQILDFSSPNPVVPSGEDAQLNWSIFNATSAEILPDIGSVDPVAGTVFFPLSTVSEYLLVATNSVGSDSATVSLSTDRPRIQFFDPAPHEVFPGGSTTLSWEILGAQSAEIQPDVGAVDPVAGSVLVTPTAPLTEYSLTATSLGGIDTRRISIPVVKPRISLQANPSTVLPGETFQLIVGIEGADSATLEPGFGAITPVDQIIETSVLGTTQFLLEATNAVGTSIVSASVFVPGSPTAVLTVNDTTPYAIHNVLFTIDLADADSARLDPYPGAISPIDQTISQLVETPTTFVLSAQNVVGSVADSVLIVPQPPLVGLSADRTLVNEGETVQLHAFIVGAASASLTPQPGSISPSTQTHPVVVTETTNFVLEATNAAGSSMDSVLVEAIPAGPAIVSFTATPQLVFPGASSLLEWQVVGNGTVELVGFGPQPMVGSLSVQPALDTTYTLRATDGQATVEETVLVQVREDAAAAAYLSTCPDHVCSVWAPIEFRPEDVYLLVVPAPGGFDRLELSLTIPPGVIAQDKQLLLPGAIDAAPGVTDVALSLSACEVGAGMLPVMKWTMVALDNSLVNVSIEIEPYAGGSSVSPPAPALGICGSAWRPFDATQDLLVSNTVPVLHLDLAWEQSHEGVRLSWDMEFEPERFSLLRGDLPGQLQPVLELSGAAAVGSQSWVDSGLNPGTTAFYRAEALVDGQRVSSELVEVVATPSSASATRLLGANPNPFNPSTTIRFQLAAPGDARIEIFDAHGRRVFERLVRGLAAGEHGMEWTGRDLSGRRVASGVYRVRLKAGDRVDSKAITLLE